MEFQPLHNMRLSDQVVDAILEMLRSGELHPGEKLPNETELAELFHVSRGILREALTLLQSQGYIRRKPKDGTYLTENVQELIMAQSISEMIKKATYCDLLDFRSALEEKIVEKAIERGSDEELDELLEILDVHNEARSLGYYFHYKLAEISQNIFYMNFIDTYYDLIEEMADRSRKDEQRQHEVEEEHRNIALAVHNRDKAAAVEAVRRHFYNADKTLNTGGQEH